MRISLKTLKIIAIFAPAIIVWLLEWFRHTFFVEQDPMVIGNLALAATVLLGSFLLTVFIFGIIERMQKESLRRNKELATLNDIASAVNESLNLDVVLYRALDKLLETAEAEAGEIFLVDEQSRQLVRRVHSGPLPEGFHTRSTFQMGEGFVGTVAERGEPTIVDDVSSSQWLFRLKVKESGLDSLVGVPMKAKDVVVGVIVLAALRPRRFTHDDAQLLVTIGNQIAVAIGNARLHEKVQEMAALEERERIAREMHDGLAQVLGYVNTKTQAARQLLATGQQERAEAALRELEDAARDTFADVREAILGLRSTDLLHKGIVTTLKEYVLRYSQQSGVKTELQVDDEQALQELPRATELQVIRVIQESLTNVRKHARASHAWVRLSSKDGYARVEVEDDGQGFDPSRGRGDNWPRFGIQSMRERTESIKGKLDIASVPGKGTKVTLLVPLDGRLGVKS